MKCRCLILIICVLILFFYGYVLAGYVITKDLEINALTFPFEFEVITNENNIKMENNEASLTIFINNYNSNMEYNRFDTTYEIFIEDSSKYTLTIEDENNGKIKGGSTNSNEITLNFLAVPNADIKNSEEMVVVIKSTSPYEKIIKFKFNINIEIVSGYIKGITKLEETQCEGFIDISNAGGYEKIYGGNNGQIEYSSDGALIFDTDNPVLYKEIEDVGDFPDKYSVYFTVKADYMQLNNTQMYSTALVAIGCGDGLNKSQNLLWMGFYKGYLQITSFSYGGNYKDSDSETVSTGFLSKNFSEYSNKIINLQVVGNRTGETKVYVNGEKIVEFESGGKEVIPEYITIGDLRPLRNLKFEGKIYDYAIYDKELTEQEVQNNWLYAKNKWIR